MTTLLRGTTPFVIFRNEVTPSFSFLTSFKWDSYSRATKPGRSKRQRPKGASNEGTCPNHRSHGGERTSVVEFRDEATRPGRWETAKIQICRASIRMLDSLRAGQKRSFTRVCRVLQQSLPNRLDSGFSVKGSRPFVVQSCSKTNSPQSLSTDSKSLSHLTVGRDAGSL